MPVFRSHCFSSFGWKLQRKFTEFSWFGPHRDSPFAVLHDAVANCQSQSHALADVFGGEKRIENFVQVFRSNAHAVIANDEQAPAMFHAAFYPNRRLLAPERFRF